MFTNTALVAMGAVFTSTLLVASTFSQACMIWGIILALWCKPSHPGIELYLLIALALVEASNFVVDNGNGGGPFFRGR